VSTPQEMGFARYMVSHYGGRLAELIHTPLGFSIKDGRRVAPIDAAAHYNHVHVAMDLGRPGVGIGDGPGRFSRFSGDGLGESARSGYRAGFRGGTLVNMLAISERESRNRHSAHNYNPPIDDSWGDLQINVLPNANPRFKNWNLSDPDVNWRAGRILFNSSGYAPWGGRGVSPFHNVTSSMFARARAAVAALGRGGGSGGGKGSKGSGPKTGSGGSSVTLHQPKAGSSPFPHILDPQNPADVFYAKQHGIPIAPTKGVARDGGSGGSSSGGDTGDPNQPLIDALAAEAEAAKNLADQLAGVKASIDAQTQFATGVSNTSNYQLMKTLADLISGHIVGYGVAGRAFTPGTGVEHVY
jgi:hypothetical protein